MRLAQIRIILALGILAFGTLVVAVPTYAHSNCCVAKVVEVVEAKPTTPLRLLYHSRSPAFPKRHPEQPTRPR